MRPHITGSKPKAQRKMDFCIGAKLCSGKAKSEDEARRICSQPKEPKAPKIKGKRKEQSCEKDSLKLAQCVLNYFEEEKLYQQILNVNSVGAAITNALMECRCPPR